MPPQNELTMPFFYMNRGISVKDVQNLLEIEYFYKLDCIFWVKKEVSEFFFSVVVIS